MLINTKPLALLERFNSVQQHSIGCCKMQQKDPVLLTDSVVEVEGTELDCDACEFWADTFRNEDLLRYQEGDVQMMITHPDETTTYELTLKASDFPNVIEDSWLTGDRFSIRVESSYFDLALQNAHTVNLEDGLATIVAEIEWRAMSDVTGIR